MRIDPRALVRRLTPSATRSLEGAVGRAATGQYHEVLPEHLLLSLLEPDEGEGAALLARAGIDRGGVLVALERVLSAVPTGHGARPVFAQTLFDWLQDAWLVASVEHGDPLLRSAALVTTFAGEMPRYTAEDYAPLRAVSRDSWDEHLRGLAADGPEAGELRASAPTAGGAPPGAPGEALARFTTSFTERARDGQLDPVLGRHAEIRQLVDVLCRRRKNNPMIVGEAGVGKTALVEGLALSVVADAVPDALKGVDIRGLDLGALQAGSGVRGEFESRLKAVLNEIKSSPTPIILFIDEAHMLIGAGGQQGTADAANLLKPELARGELRTIAATTWSEYKKFFEKDAALERRFQPVKVDAPSVEQAVLILRGLRERYEGAHGIAIRDDALTAAATLSDRYLAGRQLPDKAIDLLDSAAARARVELKAKPDALASLEAQVAALGRERDGLARDRSMGVEIDVAALASAERRLAAAQDRLESLRGRWHEERARVTQIVTLRSAMLELEDEQARAAQTAELRRLQEELAQLRGAEPPLVHGEADAEAVARVLQSWTGIPVAKMTQDQLSAVLSLDESLRARVRGQEDAVRRVAETVRMAHAGVRDPATPVGVLLFVGPSGVGKTETALALADTLFGGERFVTTINMSEFQEKHSVSRLIGSPPGYVGYGEGGVLTEAVRQRPHSVVLLDECEKADKEVMNLFYQVFDKGSLSDGEGREVDFRNTIVILTSNLASAEIMALCDADEAPSDEALAAAINPQLSRHFSPALLARMTVVPFRPMIPEVLTEVTQLKLRRLAARLRRAHGLELSFTPEVVSRIVERCRRAESGAREVDHILRGSLMPHLARDILTRMSGEQSLHAARIDLGDSGTWSVEFEA